MDYLPLPDGLNDHMLVPGLPGISYDNLGFCDYVCQGWDIKLLREGNIRGARREWNEYSQATLAEYGAGEVRVFSGEKLVQFLVALSFRTGLSTVSSMRLLVVPYRGTMLQLPSRMNAEKRTDI